MARPLRATTAGFTLTEMLVVIGIISLLTGLCVPVIKSIAGSGQTSTAIGRLAGTYELARAYAMSSHTYVRVGLANLPPAQTGGGAPAVAVIIIAATDGSLANDTATGMADNTKWTTVDKSLILSNLWNYDTLNSTAPDTSTDLKPSGTDIVSFTRPVGSLGAQSFTAIVQYNPAGEARVLKAEAARYIKIGVDQPVQPSSPATANRNQDPFMLRLSGINGSVTVLRKESLN